MCKKRVLLDRDEERMRMVKTKNREDAVLCYKRKGTKLQMFMSPEPLVQARARQPRRGRGSSWEAPWVNLCLSCLLPLEERISLHFVKSAFRGGLKKTAPRKKTNDVRRLRVR